MNHKLLHIIAIPFIVLLFGLVVAAGLGLTAVKQAQAQVAIYVDDDTCPATGSGTQGDPYCRIKDAVDAAFDGYEIRVATGTYTGTQTVAVEQATGIYTYTQVVVVTKSLTLQGGYAPDDWHTPDPAANPTVIDAQREGRGVSIVGTYNVHPVVTVDGFTITGGDYTGLGNPPGVDTQACKGTGADCGGGLFAFESALILRNSIITDNIASRDDGEGGGIYLWHGDVDPGTRIENTAIISNTAVGSGGSGGGLYALYLERPLTITGCTFQNNTATDRGGGLNLAFNIETLVTISETDFISNTAELAEGGAARIRLSENGKVLRMDRVRFQGNSAHDRGGVLYLDAAGLVTPTARLTNFLLTGNRLTSATAADALIGIAGAYTSLDVSLAHVTAADNSAVTFLYTEPDDDPGKVVTVVLTNTLLSFFSNGFAAQEVGDGQVVIQHTNTLVQYVTNLHQTVSGSPTFTATNTLSGDPRLDSTYHLQPGSAAIDAGVNAGVTHDIDGDARPQGAAPDIGVDEFIPVPPVGVSISGPTEGIVGESYTFTATPIPPTATQPISYTWSPTPTIGQGTDTAIYSWTTPGTKTLTVLLENPIGTVLVPGAHTITIQGQNIYLPLVMRNQ